MSNPNPTPSAYLPIKLFKGVQAIDGSIQPNMKAALAHSRDVKVKAALLALATQVQSTALTFGVDVPGVIYEPISDTDSKPVIDLSRTGDLADFLFAIRAEITAAFTQEVRQRKPRAQKVKSAPQPEVTI